MQAQYINPFIKATAIFLKDQTGIRLTKDSLVFDISSKTSQEVNVTINLIGSLSGSVSLGMSRRTAKRIASAIVNIDLIEDMFIGNTITAVGSAITNIACGELQKLGFDCFSTVPVLVTGKDVNITTSPTQKLSIYLASDYGRIELKAAF